MDGPVVSPVFWLSRGFRVACGGRCGYRGGSLRGSGSGTVVDWWWAGHTQTIQWNYSYTALNLTGLIDPLTGMLTLNGIVDMKRDWVSTNCRKDPGLPESDSDCLYPGPDYQIPVTITGTVNLANHTGSGKVDVPQSPEDVSVFGPFLGEWQTVP